MEKNRIFSKRKEFKKRSHAVVRSHYWLLIFVSLSLAIFGRETGYTMYGLRNYANIVTTIQSIFKGEPVGEIIEDTGKDQLSAENVLMDVITGDLKGGAKKAIELSGKQKEGSENDYNAVLGRSRGELAKFVNSISSGQIFVGLGGMLSNLVHSTTLGGALLVIISIIVSLAFAIFVENMLSVVARRIFLQARVYEKIPFSDALFIVSVRRWIKAAVTMLVKEIFHTLWMLTVIGGVIKHYAYFCVPYIVAENPDIGPLEAITLSRRMMNGHKMEAFKLDVTFLGWYVLSFFTVGLSDIFYGTAYKTACRSEFYARVRELALEERIEGSDLLIDRYLFEKADRILLAERYFDVVDEITLIHEENVELKGFFRFISEWFGIWLGSLSKKKKYDELEGRRYEIERQKLSLSGKAYPNRLHPLWRTMEIKKQGNLNFLRSYSVWTMFLLFISFSVVGWLWEVALHYAETGQFANRGTLWGPWLPIYGTGGVIVLMLCSRFRKKPVLEFFTAIVLCGVLEYFSAWYLETKYHERWWSYDGYFLNLHGRICAEGLLVFGVGCCLVVYLVAPLFDHLLSKINAKILIGISLVLAGFYFTDLIRAQSNPNMAEGAIEADEPASEQLSEGMSEMVTESGLQVGRGSF